MRCGVFLGLAWLFLACSGGSADSTRPAAETRADAATATASALVAEGDYRCLVLQYGTPPDYEPSSLIGLRIGPGASYTHLATGGTSGTYEADSTGARVTFRGGSFDQWVAEYGAVGGDEARRYLRFRPEQFRDPGPKLEIDDVMCYR